MAIVISQTLTAPFTVQLAWRFGTMPATSRITASPISSSSRSAPTAGPARRHAARPALDRPPRLVGRHGRADGLGRLAPIGSRLWLLARAKLTGRARARAPRSSGRRRYIAEALQPLVDMKIATRFDTALQQVGTDQISGTITIYRGPKTAIALQFQDLWRDFGG